MKIDRILVEERRTFTVVDEQLAYAESNQLNRASQALLLAVPFGLAGVASLFSFGTAFFVFGFGALIAYSFVAQNRVIFSGDTISTETKLLDFTYGKRSVPLLECERGVIVVINTRGGPSYHVEFAHQTGSLKVGGLENKEVCEEVIRFVDDVRASLPVPSEDGEGT